MSGHYTSYGSPNYPTTGGGGGKRVPPQKFPTMPHQQHHQQAYATTLPSRNFRSPVANTNSGPGSPGHHGGGHAGGGGFLYNTVGRSDGMGWVTSSFRGSRSGGGGGGRVEVVDGLVMNRFQSMRRQPSSNSSHQQQQQQIYSRGGGGGQSQVMNSEFYRSPSGSASSPGTTRSAGYGSSRDDSFEADVDVDIPPQYNDMSYNNNNSYSSQHPPAIPENPPTPRRPPPDNKTSLLLSREENQVIFDILGKGRQTLASAVAQLLVPTPDQSRWQIKETGVACLVRDTTKKSYFIQVFSLGTRSMVFRQEIYNQFEYNLPNHCFLTFEGDSSTVGILFADPTEAGLFREGLDSKLEAKRQRRNEREHRRSRLIPDNHGPPYPQSQSHNQPPQSHPQKQVPAMTNGVSTVSTTYNFPTKPNSNKAKTNNKKDKNKKPTLRKEDIGQPMDFRHVQHVGWDPKRGFDLNGVDSDLRVFFEKAGVSSDVLQDENTRQFIYNFIEQNGGLDQIRSTSRPAAPPPPPAISNPNAPPPPVPNRTVQALKPAAPPPPPSRPVPPVPGYNQGIPPPPPPMRTSSSNVVEKSPSHQVSSPNNGPARPPPPTFSNSSPKQTSHSNGPIPPPPPPPPPMPVAGMPPPPPPPPMGMPNAPPPPQSNNNGAHNNAPKSSLPVMDDRSNLLAQIQKGVNLKKVDASDTPPKRSAGGLADCLNQIQTGVALKPVQQTQKEPPTTDTMDGLAGALARALAERSKAINPDSSSEEEEEAEDDEWD